VQHRGRVEVQGGAQEEIRSMLRVSLWLLWGVTRACRIGLQGRGGPRMGGTGAAQRVAQALGDAAVLPPWKGCSVQMSAAARAGGGARMWATAGEEGGGED
jgi:hypothetical protein